jgi:ribosomal protein L37AE/L43A
MTNKKNMMCMICEKETEHFHRSGWWKCAKCHNNTVKAKLGNTNRDKGEDRGYDASGEAHNKIPKGSHRSVIKR